MRKIIIIIAVVMALPAMADGTLLHGNRDHRHDDNVGRDDGFRGWRDQNGFLHGNSENPNMRGTVYCWANGVWICP